MKKKYPILERRNVCTVTKGGRRRKQRVVVVVGGNGSVGIGTGKSLNVSQAIEKAVVDGFKNTALIPITNTKTISHIVYGSYGKARVILKPAIPGTGILAGKTIKSIAQVLGIKNILAKQLGSKNVLNNARATIRALMSLQTQTTK
jgi:small subunit ribosomal protein S5